MKAKFLIQPDPEHGLLRIVMADFFTPADLDRFVAAGKRALADLGLPANAHMTLNDVRRMKIQSADMVDALRNLLADPATRSRRLALVVGPTLFRPQLLRALDGRHARIFDTIEEAEAYLLDSNSAEGVCRRAA